MQEYYTLQIHYNGSKLDKCDKVEFSDLSPGEGKDFNTWAKEVAARTYTQGFKLQTAPGCWELVNPFRIHTVFIIKQDKKFAP